MKFTSRKPVKRSTGIYVEVEILDRINGIAKENKLTPNEIISQLLIMGLTIVDQKDA